MGTVYLLGAGFSRGAGAPLLREAMEKGVLAGSNRGDLAQIKLCLDRLFAPENGLDSLNLEEILSRLDLELYYQSGERECLSFIRQQLVSLFLDVLEQCSARTLPPEYLGFADLLKFEDAIINLNYDLVVEKALEIERRFYPDYGLFSLNGQEGREPFLVLKPHGSLNLYYCPHCLKIDLLVSEQYSGIINRYGLQGDCGHPLRPLVITPTLYKSYHLEQLREVWFRCLTVLRSAEKIVFVGYSLPKADILLAQTLDYARRLRGNGQEIVVINGSFADCKQIEQLYRGKIVNTKLSFKDWVKSFKYS